MKLLLLTALLFLTACSATGNPGEPTSPTGPLSIYLENAVTWDLEIGTFAEAYRQDGLQDVRELLRNECCFTALIPTNDAIDAYLKDKGMSKEAFFGSSEVVTVVKRHLFRGNYSVEDLLSSGSLVNLNGEIISITTTNGQTFANNAPFDGLLLGGTRAEGGTPYHMLAVISPN